MRKLAIFLAITVFFLSLLAPVQVAYAQYSPNFYVGAEAVYMINLETDMLIYEKNSTQRVYPASLTKIMTAILAIEHIADLENTQVTMSIKTEDTIYRANIAVGGGLSLAGMLRGETMSAKNLLYAIMLPSGNEAAMTLAEYIGDGSVPYFIELMNEKAKEIGAVNTNFVNSNGLHDENHYTTAYDMYLIARYAMELPGFMDIANTTYYNGGPTNKHTELHWQNTNKLLDRNSEYYYAPVSGIKTGSTPEAGRCVITTATRDGYNYMLVVMGAPYYENDGKTATTNYAFTATKALYQWAFDTFKVKTLIEKGKSVGEVKLRFADKKDHLLLMSGERFTALLPAEIEASSITFETVLPSSVAAPVERGQQIGEVRLILANEEIGRVPLVAAETVEANTLMVLLYSFTSLFDTFLAKFILVFFILLLLGYIALMVVRNRNKRKYGTVKRRRPL